ERACLQEKIDEIERALRRLQRRVTLEAVLQIDLEQRRKIRVGALLEFTERVVEPLPPLPDVGASVALAEAGAAALSRTNEVSVVPQIDEQRLETVKVVWRYQAVDDSGPSRPRPHRVEIERIPVPGRAFDRGDERFELVEQPRDLGWPVEGVAAPAL